MVSARSYNLFSLANEATWRFPDNQNGEIKGFNDAGVSTFDGNTLRSMVRESIQNSLDAARPDSTSVRVEFELYKIKPSDIPGKKDLLYALKQCKASAARGSKAYRFFSQAIEDCNMPLPILRISDHGTTGLRGAETGDLSSDWSRLVKQSGSSSKNDFSGGSFGIGKYAYFACSAMRTVFFASLDDAGVESNIGVARLTSFKDRGVTTSGIGYYSDNDRNNATLAPLAFPHALQRSDDDPGTDIYIIDCVQRDHFMRTIKHEVLSSFLVSIWKRLLEVEIDGQIINARNLARIIGELNYENDDDRALIEHFSLLSSGTEGVRTIVLDPAEHQYAYKYKYPKGSATLYLKQGDKLNRSVMMTRSQGMKLFDQKGISGTIQFTGILMIEGEKMNEDFREMEAPSHDKWEPERASNQRRASECYKLLRQWIRDEVQKAFAHVADEQIDAFNVGLYLPAIRDVGTTIKNRTPGRKPNKESSLKRKKASVRKRQLKPAGKNEHREMPDFDVSGSSAESNTTRRKSSSKKKNQDTNSPLSGLTQMEIRPRAMATSRAGAYRLKFVVPRNVSRFVLAVHCKGEISDSDLDIRSTDVIRGDVSLVSINDNRIGFGPCKHGEVVELEMTTGFDRYCMLEVDFYAAK